MIAETAARAGGSFRNLLFSLDGLGGSDGGLVYATVGGSIAQKTAHSRRQHKKPEEDMSVADAVSHEQVQQYDFVVLHSPRGCLERRL